MDTSISSPPCPQRFCRAEDVSTAMRTLISWALEELRDVDELLATAAPEARSALNFGDYEHLANARPPVNRPIMCQAADLIGMRLLRRLWDSVVADYENEWETKRALLARLNVVVLSLRLALSSTTPAEVREHNAQQADWETTEKLFNSVLGVVTLLPDIDSSFLRGD